MILQNERQFWVFMHARECIRLRRLEGRPPKEWSTDPIFQNYSFTNVKRNHDRTTMLLNHDFYAPNRRVHPSPVGLVNAALFRFFGKIETAREIGWSETWGAERHGEVVSQLLNKFLLGQKIFTSAYIIPSCGDSRPKVEVVGDIIDGIWERSDEILDCITWEELVRRMKLCWGVGSFMAKEICLDYMLATGWIPADWRSWTPVGPGARRGAGVVMNGIIKGISEWEALTVIRQLYSRRDDNWPADFVTLDLTDIQFQLCEFAKYEKARTGVGRPKRKFRPTIDLVTKGSIL